MIQRRLIALRDVACFSATVHRLVDTLNHEAGTPEKLASRLPSHPLGFVREITKRRLTIAECYLKLMTLPGAEHWQERLTELRTLVNQAWHAKTLSLPLNTARVQVALMKRCLENRHDRQCQLEAMSDFALASHGQVPVIRRLLKELDLIEVPEDGRALREMGLGWDDHVHDFLTEGQKTPSQLVLDAFIKGISRITVAYYTPEDPRSLEETIRAGEILGIDAEVAVEFGVGQRCRRSHYIFIPPGACQLARFRTFIQENGPQMAPFIQGLKENADRRQRTISALLDQFNESSLKELNLRWQHHPHLQVGAISWEDVRSVVHGGQVSRIHLGQLLWMRILPVLHKRVLYLKNQLREAEDQERNGGASTWESESLRQRYLEVRREYTSCTPALMQHRYLPSRERADYDSAFQDEADILPSLVAMGGRVAYIHPLSSGVEGAVRNLVHHCRLITDVEVFNAADSGYRDPVDLKRMCLLVSYLNAGRAEEARHLLVEWGVNDPLEGSLEEACAWYQAHPLNPRFASDYVGQKDRVPGIGFVATHDLTPQNRRILQRNRHVGLGEAASRLVIPNPRGPEDQVFMLSAPASLPQNRVGDEPRDEGTGLLRIWRYLNLDLKFLVKVAVGFIPATLVVGPWYGLLWLGITGTRNLLVDLVSASGFSIRSWKTGDVDRDNLANSMFWTGFSVPVLGAVKMGFDALWPLVGPSSGLLYAFVKFFCLAFANGLYITSHNRLRGFDRSVLRANFFRTVLSWPLAALGSFGLDLLGIPAIVQAKIWSEVVAAVIEGTGKWSRRMRMSMRTYLELFESLLDPDPETRLVARADILVVWARRHQGRAALRRLIEGRFKAVDPVSREIPLARSPEQLRLALKRLSDDFQREGSLTALTNLILQHYNGNEAATLTDLLASQHSAFVRWIRARCRNGQDDGSRGPQSA